MKKNSLFTIATSTIILCNIFPGNVVLHSKNIRHNINEKYKTRILNNSIPIPYNTLLNGKSINDVNDILKWLSKKGYTIKKSDLEKVVLPTNHNEVKYIHTNQKIPKGYELLGKPQIKSFNYKNDSLLQNGWNLVSIENDYINKNQEIKIPSNINIDGSAINNYTQILKFLKTYYNKDVKLSELIKVKYPILKTVVVQKSPKSNVEEKKLISLGYQRTKSISNNIDPIESAKIIDATGKLAPFKNENYLQYVKRMKLLGYQVKDFNDGICSQHFSLEGNRNFDNREQLKSYINSVSHKVNYVLNLNEEISNMKLISSTGDIYVNSWNELFEDAKSNKFSLELFTYMINHNLLFNEFSQENRYSDQDLDSNGLPKVVNDWFNDTNRSTEEKFFVTPLLEKPNPNLENQNSGVSNIDTVSKAINYYNNIIDILNEFITEDKLDTNAFEHLKIFVKDENNGKYFEDVKQANEYFKTLPKTINSYQVYTSNHTFLKAFNSRQDAQEYINQRSSSPNKVMRLYGELSDGTNLNMHFSTITTEQTNEQYSKIINNRNKIYKVGDKYFITKQEAENFIYSQAVSGLELFNMQGNSISSSNLSMSNIQAQLSSFAAHFSASGEMRVDGKLMGSISVSGHDSWRVYDPENKLNLSASEKNKEFDNKEALLEFINSKVLIKTPSNYLNIQEIEVKNLSIDDTFDNLSIVEQRFAPFMKLTGTTLNSVIQKVMDKAIRPIISKDGFLAIGSELETKEFFSNASEIFKSIDTNYHQSIQDGFKFLEYTAPTIDELIDKLLESRVVESTRLCSRATSKLRRNIYFYVYSKQNIIDKHGLVTIPIREHKYVYSRQAIRRKGTDGYIKFRTRTFNIDSKKNKKIISKRFLTNTKSNSEKNKEHRIRKDTKKLIINKPKSKINKITNKKKYNFLSTNVNSLNEKQIVRGCSYKLDENELFVLGGLLLVSSVLISKSKK